MEDDWVYEIFYTYGAFYIDKNRFGSIMIVGMTLLSKSMVWFFIFKHHVFHYSYI